MPGLPLRLWFSGRAIVERPQAPSGPASAGLCRHSCRLTA